MQNAKSEQRYPPIETQVVLEMLERRKKKQVGLNDNGRKNIDEKKGNHKTTSQKSKTANWGIQAQEKETRQVKSKY